MTAISVSERLLEMAAFYTPLALTVTICVKPSHFITINAQTMASLGKPRRPVAALGSVKSKLLKSLS